MCGRLYRGKKMDVCNRMRMGWVVGWICCGLSLGFRTVTPLILGATQLHHKRATEVYLMCLAKGLKSVSTEKLGFFVENVGFKFVFGFA